MQATSGCETYAANKIIYPSRPGFKKGQSGNPAGRPKTNLKVQQFAREKTLDALKVLCDIAADPKTVPTCGCNQPEAY